MQALASAKRQNTQRITSQLLCCPELEEIPHDPFIDKFMTMHNCVCVHMVQKGLVAEIGKVFLQLQSKPSKNYSDQILILKNILAILDELQDKLKHRREFQFYLFVFNNNYNKSKTSPTEITNVNIHMTPHYGLNPQTMQC